MSDETQGHRTPFELSDDEFVAWLRDEMVVEEQLSLGARSRMEAAVARASREDSVPWEPAAVIGGCAFVAVGTAGISLADLPTLALGTILLFAYSFFVRRSLAAE